MKSAPPMEKSKSERLVAAIENHFNRGFVEVEGLGWNHYTFTLKFEGLNYKCKAKAASLSGGWILDGHDAVLDGEPHLPSLSDSEFLSELRKIV